MTLQEMILPHLALTNADVAALLNDPTVEQRDAQLWTYAGLAIRFGSTVVGVIDEVLKATPGMDWVRLLLAGKGIDFSLEQSQLTLETMRAVSQLADYIDDLKAIGRWTVSPWQADGNQGLVTVQQIASARAELAAESARAAVEQWWAGLSNELVNPLIAGGATVAEIKAAIAEAE